MDDPREREDRSGYRYQGGYDGHRPHGIPSTRQEEPVARADAQLVTPAGGDAARGGPEDRRGKSGEPAGRDARLAGARTVTGAGAGRHGGGSNTTIH